jgi:GTP-binding protein YchF
MRLSAGIVGLPNVGKSTLFNAITNLNVEAANYPFATINPNHGIVKLFDQRLQAMALLISPEKVTNATFEFVDIAGLVKGASKGEGLGNQFLANIREVNAICHVVRCFENEDITHVEGSVDPIRDVEIINYELIASDIDSIDKRFSKVNNKAKSGDKEAIAEADLLKKMRSHLNDGKLGLSLNLSREELSYFNNMTLLTVKPVIFVANIDEESIKNPESNKHYNKIKDYASKNNSPIIAISANIESEISKLDEEDKKIFLKDIGIEKSGLDTIVRTSYNMLNLATYFTYGKQEVRAWQFVNGMTAPECAGLIHTDFQKGFIRAEVMKYDDLLLHKDENLVRSLGKIKQEGKDYVMKDGDICHFKFNVTK